MKSYFITWLIYARFILAISGEGMKILELQGTLDQKQFPLIKVVPISNDVYRILETLRSFFSLPSFRIGIGKPWPVSQMFLQIKFDWKITILIHLFSMAAFMWQWQNSVVVTWTMWSAKSEIFADPHFTLA